MSDKTITTKEKLLEVLGDFAHDDLSVNGLLDVLRVKLDRQEEIIKELRSENAAERAKLFQDREYLHQEIKEIHRNPNCLISLQKYFQCQNGNYIEVLMHKGQLQAFEQIGKAKVKYAMQSVPLNQVF